MLKNKIPFDAAVVQKEATRIGELGAMIPDAFQVDTRKATVKTKGTRRHLDEPGGLRREVG